MRRKNIQKFELVAFLLYPILAVVTSLYFKVDVLMGVFLFLGLPAIYLSFRVPINTTIRSFIFSVLFVPIVCVANYLAHINAQWLIPVTKVPFYIGGVPMFEVSLWALFLAHFTILFYEYFIDKHFVKKKWYPKMRGLLKILILAPTTFLLVNNFFPMTYFYLIFGVIGMVVPIILIEFKQPKLMAKFIKAAMYFFYLTFLYEVTALKLNHWSFPVEGKFIGWVLLFGERFPIEEFVFWLALCAMATLSYFEYFDDDYK